MRPKNNGNSSGEDFKKASENFTESGKNIGKGLVNNSKGIYKILDNADKKIGSKINNTKHSIINYTKNNILKILIASSIIAYGGNKVSNFIDKDDNKEKKEISKQKISNDYRDNNPNFFKKGFKSYLDIQHKDQGIELVRDVGLTFYIVQKGDNLTKIIKKLSQIEEFSYLKQEEYKVGKDRNIKSFNIDSQDLKVGQKIPIPINREFRELKISEFKEYSKQAINEIISNEIYGEKIKKLLDKIGEEELVNIMVAFARCETAQDYDNFNDLIGNVTYHRWEDHLNCFSFSPYHILMEKNADGKSDGPGLRARKKLGFTEGQCNHPKNAGKLFLAYWIEKTNGDIEKIFPITQENYKKVGKTYNGASSYGNKLQNNLNYIENFGKFNYERESNDGKKVYSYICEKELDYKQILSKFQKKFNIDISNIKIHKSTGDEYGFDEKFDEGKKIYLK